MARTRCRSDRLHSTATGAPLSPRAATPIAGYLNGHAEAEATQALQFSGAWSHAICIPACNETKAFGQTLDSIRTAASHSAHDAESRGPLVILVANGAVDAPSAFHQQNAAFLDWLYNGAQTTPDSMVLGRWGDLDLLIVDRATAGRRLAAKQGVGLARKMAADIALALHNRGDIASPWIVCTDADVWIPPHTLDALPPADSPYSAAVFPFEHQPEGAQAAQLAMLQYESFLHYQVLGLHWAGSPYAFHTVGSTIAFHAHRYAMVRGYPKRRAGEDFYLLNKMAKIAPVMPLNTTPFRIRGRPSDRVPFGTGPALRRIEALHRAGTPYAVTHPQIFAGLRAWLKIIADFAQAPNADRLEQWLQTDTSLPPGILHGALHDLGAVQAAVDAAQQAPAGAKLHRRLLEWNDGFRTLKLIHAIRDRGLRSMPLAQALREAPFIPTWNTEEPHQHLHAIRKHFRIILGHPVGIGTPPTLIQESP